MIFIIGLANFAFAFKEGDLSGCSAARLARPDTGVGKAGGSNPNMKMKYVVYILESQSSGRLYIGYTNDLGRRFKEHNSNQTKSTRSKGPWTLLYAKEGLEKTEAMELERRLKNWKNRKRVLSWIEREKAT